LGLTTELPALYRRRRRRCQEKFRGSSGRDAAPFDGTAERLGRKAVPATLTGPLAATKVQPARLHHSGVQWLAAASPVRVHGCQTQSVRSLGDFGYELRASHVAEFARDGYRESSCGRSRRRPRRRPVARRGRRAEQSGVQKPVPSIGTGFSESNMRIQDSRIARIQNTPILGTASPIRHRRTGDFGYETGCGFPKNQLPEDGERGFGRGL